MDTPVIDQMTTSPPSAKFTSASVGKKILMAISGIILIGFVIAHMAGNLQIFIGQEQLNKYAETLQTMGALKWGFRLFILIFTFIHIWKGVVLWIENKQARPVGYHKEDTIQATVASRTMIYTGLIIFLFVVYHILHFTLIVTNPEYTELRDSANRFDVYSMVIYGFSNYLISGVYIVAMFMLSFHLSHAILSFFQSLGLNNTRYNPMLKFISYLVSIIVFIGYVSIPVAVMLQIIKLPAGGY